MGLLNDLVDTRMAQKIAQISGVGMVSIAGGQRQAVAVHLRVTDSTDTTARSAWPTAAEGQIFRSFAPLAAPLAPRRARGWDLPQAFVRAFTRVSVMGRHARLADLADVAKLPVVEDTDGERTAVGGASTDDREAGTAE